MTQAHYDPVAVGDFQSTLRNEVSQFQQLGTTVGQTTSLGSGSFGALDNSGTLASAVSAFANEITGELNKAGELIPLINTALTLVGQAKDENEQQIAGGFDVYKYA